MKYSVVVPVYNAEGTLKRLLDIFEKQMREDAEIVLINDGSKDSSLEICNAYHAKHPEFFKVFDQENRGVSPTRNRGLQEATGDYVLFVDSDDYVSDQYFEIIDAAVEKDHSDMVLYGMEFLGRSKQSLAAFVGRQPETKEQLVDFLAELFRAGFMNSLCSKAFRRSIFIDNDLQFDTEIRISEDIAMIYAYLLYVQKISVVDETLYLVDETGLDSLSRKKRDYLESDLIRSVEDMVNALENAKVDAYTYRKFYELASRAFYRSVYSVSKELNKSDLSKAERKKEIKGICNRFLQKNVKAVGKEATILSIPVRFKMTGVINKMVQR